MKVRVRSGVYQILCVIVVISAEKCLSERLKYTGMGRLQLSSDFSLENVTHVGNMGTRFLETVDFA